MTSARVKKLVVDVHDTNNPNAPFMKNMFVSLFVCLSELYVPFNTFKIILAGRLIYLTSYAVYQYLVYILDNCPVALRMPYSTQTDQRLWCSLPRQYNISSFYILDFKTLASLCS